MFPINITLGKVIINSHLLFEILAYTLGFRYFLYLRKKAIDRVSESNRIWILIGAGFGAVIGSRLLGFFSTLISGLNVSQAVLLFFSSKSIVGGLLGGLIGVEITKKFLNIKFSTGDLLTYPIILAMIIGRVGCFLQGVHDGTHGTASTLPWAIDMGDGILRHPTSLYEVIFLAALWVVLRKIDHRLIEGARFKLFITAYLVFRFFIEFIKPVYIYPVGISAIQIVCLAGLIYYWKVLLFSQSLFKQI